MTHLVYYAIIDIIRNVREIICYQSPREKLTFVLSFINVQIL